MRNNILAVLMVLLVSLFAFSAPALAGFGFAEAAYSLKIGVPSLQFKPSSIEDRGGAIMLNYGHFFDLNMGTNRINVGYVTGGIGFQSGIPGQSVPTVGKQLGVLVGCATSVAMKDGVAGYIEDACIGPKFDFDRGMWLLDVQLPVLYRLLESGGAAIGL